MSQSTRAKLLCIGLPPQVREALCQTMTAPEITAIESPEQWESLFNAEGLDFSAAFCGPNPFGIQSLEIAQACASFLPGAPMYFAALSAKDLAVKDLIKNGFRQVFLFPADKDIFADTMAQIERTATGRGRTIQRAVSLIDVDPGEPLDFEVSIYLRMNKKYIRIINEGKSLDQAKIDKFKSYQVDRVFIDAAKIDRFYKYTAEKLRKLNQPQSGISETERLDKLQQSLRKIVHNIFDTSADSGFEQGREIFEDTTKIVSNMIGTHEAISLHNELSKALAQPTTVSTRASRVSTFAALFEMAVGLKMTQQAAIAGLFLDLGLAQLPPELQSKKYSEMTIDEQKLYASHPTLSVNILQAKRMAVPPEVKAAILQHHEKYSGDGFPNQVPGHKLAALSQIVAVADRFEELAFSAENPQPLPLIIEHLRSERICSPEILRSIQTLVSPPAKAA